MTYVWSIEGVFRDLKRCLKTGVDVVVIVLIVETVVVVETEVIEWISVEGG